MTMRVLLMTMVVMIAPAAVAWAQTPAPAPPGRATAPSAATPPAPQGRGIAPAPAPNQPPPGRQGGAATPAPAAPATPAPAGLPAATPEAPPGFTYSPEGRRDPFVSLLRRAAGGVSTASAATRPSGLAGLETGEVTLKGTIQTQTGFVAILQGTDKKTYIVRPGDRLLDGTVRSIVQNAMVILQQVNDPLSLEKQREVRKVLRQTDEAK